MRYSLLTPILGLGLLSLTACTKDYLDINSNPYQPASLVADDYLLGSTIGKVAGSVISNDVNTTQFTECLLGGVAGGYFASAGAFQNTFDNFNPKNDWSRVLMHSDKIIPQLYTNLDAIESYARQTDDQVPLAFALIMKVLAMHRVADAYGPIPYSKISVGGKIEVPYDSQPELYQHFFEDLDAALKILREHRGESYVLRDDYVYGGNIQRWAKLANSLKLRLALRIVYADQALAKAKAEEAVRDDLGLITDNADNAQWNFFATTVNPLYVATSYNRPLTATHGGDSQAAADIICYMNGYNDPRRAKFFTPSDWGAEYEYVGLRRGIIIPALGTVGYKYSSPLIQSTQPVLWMNAAEVAFLRAEAKAVFGFDMGGSAEDFYNQGIRLSFAQWGVAGADAYLQNNQLTPTAYRDPSGADSYPENLSLITIRWDEGATTEEKQERIITQKWIANWMLGNEAWADYRRTGYPRLMPATQAGNKSNGLVDSRLGIRRLPYPQEEFSSNGGRNVKEAIASYLHGPDAMSTRLWWDAKPAN